MRNDGYIGDMGRTDYDDTLAENAEYVVIFFHDETVLERLYETLRELV